MKEIISMLDNKLKYIGYDITDDEIHIYVKSKRKVLICPYCGKKTRKVHSTYRRTIQDYRYDRNTGMWAGNKVAEKLPKFAGGEPRWVKVELDRKI